MRKFAALKELVESCDKLMDEMKLKATSLRYPVLMRLCSYAVPYICHVLCMRSTDFVKMI